MGKVPQNIGNLVHGLEYCKGRLGDQDVGESKGKSKVVPLLN